jgi:hypothetical protein
MQNAIVFISQPSDERMLTHERERVWRGIENTVEKILEQAKHGEQLAEGAWLFPLRAESGALETISTVIQAAKENHCPYRVLLVEEEPNWIA